MIDYLAIKLHTGNKASKGELTSVMNMHEETSEDDSRLPTKVRRKKVKLKHWKVRLIEEIKDKLRERKIELIENEENH